ncbi:hypothetical protein CH380_06690 [Leptospira adleri]|uniref:Uncharacterized protein n=1 Tax=Leptospira adleri TaxID=2023186 RepID=A0A2M9YRR3_9LEPT|nr:hypothetical protein CH380_06690 [Leptospira adleri]PJZ62350.1 hypothetical protein CH376_08300 [Leptospira adleri]
MDPDSSPQSDDQMERGNGNGNGKRMVYNDSKMVKRRNGNSLRIRRSLFGLVLKSGNSLESALLFELLSKF